MSEFPNIVDATRVEPVGDRAGLYAALVSKDWIAPVFPSGGVTATAALHAMETELGQPHQTLRSFSTMFVTTVESGSLEVAVEKLRVGKRMSQLRADVYTAGGQGPGHVVTAAFGESREGFEFSYADAPDVDEPESYPDLAEAPPGTPVFRPPFFEQVEVRRVRVFASFELHPGSGDVLHRYAHEREHAHEGEVVGRRDREVDEHLCGAALGSAVTMPVHRHELVAVAHSVSGGRGTCVVTARNQGFPLDVWQKVGQAWIQPDLWL